jgi:hypothetical protein
MLAPCNHPHILVYVAQVTIYLPDGVLERLRQDAKRSGKSVSAFVLERIAAPAAADTWPEGFGSLFGGWEGSFPVPDDPPPDEVEGLE